MSVFLCGIFNPRQFEEKPEPIPLCYAVRRTMYKAVAEGQLHCPVAIHLGRAIPQLAHSASAGESHVVQLDLCLGIELILVSVDQQAPAKTFCRMRHVDLAMTRSWPSSAGTIAASPSSSPVCESPMEPSGYSDIPDFQASNKG